MRARVCMYHMHIVVASSSLAEILERTSRSTIKSLKRDFMDSSNVRPDKWAILSCIRTGITPIHKVCLEALLKSISMSTKGRQRENDEACTIYRYSTSTHSRALNEKLNRNIRCASACACTMCIYISKGLPISLWHSSAHIEIDNRKPQERLDGFE